MRQNDMTIKKKKTAYFWVDKMKWVFQVGAVVQKHQRLQLLRL